MEKQLVTQVAECKKMLQQLRMEAEILKARCDEGIKELQAIKTKEDADAFANKWDSYIDENLKHIEIF